MTEKSADDKVRGTARVMVIIAWVFALMFLTYLFQEILDDRHNPNRQLEMLVGDDGTREVVLARNAQGHYVANGLVNGELVTFLLDTGATDVAVPGDLAERLGLVRERSGFSQTANGTVRVWSTRLQSVQLGAVRLDNVRATIVPSMQAGSPVLLGMSFLRQLEMIQRGGVLRLRQGTTRG